MSLIDEALKRARLEAAQRAAEGEGLPYPTIPRHLAPPRRRRWLVPAAVAAAMVAGLAVGLLLASRGGTQPDRVAATGGGDTAQPVTGGPATAADLVRDPPPIAADPEAPEGAPAGAPSAGGPSAGDPPTPEPAVPAAVPPGAPAAQPVTSGPASPAELTRDPPAPAAAEPLAESAPSNPPRPAPRADRPPRAAAPANQTPRLSEPTPPAAERPAPPASPSPRAEPAPAAPPRQAAAPPEPPPAATTVTDPDSGMLLVLPEREAGAPAGAPAETPVESHVRQFPLPGGGAIELGGIAWSETGPFALINGRVVGPGSTIGEYTLERIQPGHVELAGGGRRIRLSLQ